MIPALAIESKSLHTLAQEDPEYSYDGSDTFTDILERKLAKGNTSEINDLIIFKDDKLTIYFKDDIWPFLDSDIDSHGAANLKFDIDDGTDGAQNVHSLKDVISEIKFQLKSFVLVSIYISDNEIQLRNLGSKLNKLKQFVPKLIAYGVDDFSKLTDEKLNEIAFSDPKSFDNRTKLEGLNALYDAIPWLPFDIQYRKLNSADFGKEWIEPDQYPVVPLRIYLDLLSWGKERVEYYKGLTFSIEKSIEQLLEFERAELQYAIHSIRHGKRPLSWGRGSSGSKRFSSELMAKGVELVDYGENPLWIKLFEEAEYFTISLRPDRVSLFIVNIDGKFYNRAEFKNYLREVVGTCGFMCLALSGMRVDELYGAHIDYGAQKLTLSDSKINYGKETIHLITTRQSKITRGSQTKKDTFVTTKVGYDAFKVLSSVYREFNNRFKSKDKRRMFAGFRSCQSVKPCSISTLSHYIADAVKDISKVDLKIKDADLVYLNTSDPTKSMKLGDEFLVTNHTLRRSLAYYLVGYELCSFPALKQQLSHISIAMTRWYARNSSQFSSTFELVTKERVEQLADIYTRIYYKLANGERVAGGKGKQAAYEISRQGENYFKDGDNKNLLSREYWVQQLKDDVKHLHVIAPSMVCTNKMCSMRINIDLSECVDCDYDFIEDAAFAETSRMDAMRNLHFLHEQKDLNSSSLTKLVMTIRAAEKIMDDLNFKYEPYILTAELSGMLIPNISNTEAL